MVRDSKLWTQLIVVYTSIFPPCWAKYSTKYISPLSLMAAFTTLSNLITLMHGIIRYTPGIKFIFSSLSKIVINRQNLWWCNTGQLIAHGETIALPVCNEMSLWYQMWRGHTLSVTPSQSGPKPKKGGYCFSMELMTLTYWLRQFEPVTWPTAR